MTMRFALLLVGALVLGCDKPAPSLAQPPVQVVAADDNATPVRPLLWSIEKAGKTSHVLGTMHVGVDPDRLPAHVWDTLDAATTLAVETDLSGAAALPVLRTDGTSLRDALGPAYWTKLEDAIGVGEAARLAPFKPMIPATIVATHGLPETRSIDGELEKRARARGTPVVFLETLELQFAAIEKWLDTRALKDMLDDIAIIEKQSGAMLNAFTTGDETGILAITERERQRWLAKGRSAAEYDAQLEDILYRRNASWIAPIEELHARGSGFVAVGAAHLVGPRSVLALLADRGFTVTRVTR